MSMSDTIADMLTRIRNGQHSRLMSVMVPHSKMKVGVLDVLVEEGFVDSYSVGDVKPGIKEIEVNLRYTAEGRPVIRNLEKMSKPGRRQYSPVSELKGYYNNMGVYILSTSKGIVSDRRARVEGVGGEIICRVF